MSKQDKIALLSQNIPDELKQLNQWVVWKYTKVKNSDKPTKPPYNANTGNKASVTNPNDWCSYSDAINCLANGDNYNGIGLVLTKNDPYFVGDLDNANGNVAIIERQKQIAEQFDTYSEISPSGMGLHIVGKGSILSGRRRDCIEIYSSERYITFTGNVYQNKPIRDCQTELTNLYNELSKDKINGVTHTIDDEPERETDDKIIEQCRSAVNGDRFLHLFAGSWQGDYPSQSEADLALVNIIAYYTKNRNQIIRIFRASGLGKRPKASRTDYINGLVQKSLDQTLPELDFELYNKEIEDKLKINNRPVAQLVEPIPHKNLVTGSSPVGPTIHPPPGLLGDLAKFIYQAAPRPVPEIALAAAIGLMAGICGRAYNISGTGLNQYVLLIAKTGSGKEGAASGIDKLINSIKMITPTAVNFRGPGIINSGQALAKYIGKAQSHCFLSVLGEFGIRLENMSSANALSSEKALKALLLDLYNKSGLGQTVQANIYSSENDSVAMFESPAFSLLGESTAERFYSILNENMISEGLLPRFTIIEYKGKRPPFNEHHQNFYPNNDIVNKLSNLVAYVEQLSFEKPRKVIKIEQSKEASKLTRDFDKFADEKINSTNSDVIAELWNRAHMKVLKLSALIAIGVDGVDNINHKPPLIVPEYVNWSIDLIVSDIKALSAKFTAGEIGEKPHDESKQLNDITRTIKEYLTNRWRDVMPYCSSKKEMHENKLIPYEYFNRRTGKLTSFKTDNQGATAALKKCLQVLIDSGKIVERTKDVNIINKFGYQGRVFEVKNSLFD